jgi:1-acyl-sn-glycerol-3-phosphate acyltransferase
LPFHRGLFGLARLARVPIVPLALSYDHPAAAWVGDTWFLPHYVRTTLRDETRALVRAGTPIAPTLPASDLAALTRDKILELLK